jgi:hypothetical protein
MAIWFRTPWRSATPSLSGFPGLSDCGIEGYRPLQQEHERGQLQSAFL